MSQPNQRPTDPPASRRERRRGWGPLLLIVVAVLSAPIVLQVLRNHASFGVFLLSLAAAAGILILAACVRPRP